MTYGPCGGVRHDLTCELGSFRCPFADLDTAVPWTGPTRAASGSADRLSSPDGGPLVLTDLTVKPFDPASIERVCAAMAGSCDAVLVGEHRARPDFPPTQMVPLVRAAGVEPLVTLACRDRNRAVLEQELAGLAAMGAAGVLCVTGDGRPPSDRPEVVTEPFDLDGTELAYLAATAGLFVAVPESPGAEPIGLRPGRLREKQRAGADLCILNRTRTIEETATFVHRARRAGVTIPIVGAVAVFTDAPSAHVLQAFPGLELPDELVERVIGARDPVTAGIDLAVEQARALLAIEGIAGVNLSGLASGHSDLAGAEIKTAIGQQLRSAAS
ncbi:MAG: methylenetetrahydrofolate reductase [Acidimicrobiia bacterium]|nr:methylenetetrahydrofolate reductase [Acidimicrobiia bacterium]